MSKHAGLRKYLYRQGSADEIEDRLDLGDAVHQVFDADDDLDCYHEAILRAIVLKGVRV